MLESVNSFFTTPLSSAVRKGGENISLTRLFFLPAELVGLLKWRLKPNDVSSALKAVLRVEAEEIVKVIYFDT